MQPHITETFAEVNGITTAEAEQIIAGQAPLQVGSPALLTGMVGATVYEEDGDLFYREEWHAPWLDGIGAGLPPRSFFGHHDAFPEFRGKFIEVMRGLYGHVYRDLIRDNQPGFLPKEDPATLSDEEFIDRIYSGDDDIDDPLFFDGAAIEWAEFLEEIINERAPGCESGCGAVTIATAALPQSMADAPVADLRAHLRSVVPGTDAVQSIAGVDPTLPTVMVPPWGEGRWGKGYLGPDDWHDPAAID